MRILGGVALLSAVLLSGTAHADFQGVTYELDYTTTSDPLTNLYALKISGENTAADLEGGVNAGRTGINALAFTKPNNISSATMLLPSTGYTYKTGGLDSDGCNGSGNFFCFDNTAIPPIPTTPLSGTLLFIFDITLSSGNFNTYLMPSFKIDWVGLNTHNYDLVSAPLTAHLVCTTCIPDPRSVPVPEPGSLAILGGGLLGMAGFIKWRQRKYLTNPTPA